MGRSVSAASASGTVATAGGALFSPIAWAFVGVCFTAQATCDYRLMKQNKMTKEQFKQNMKVNAIKAGGGLVGSSAGAATGFLIGTAICPGVGSAIGTFGGAIAGGIFGGKLAKKSVGKIDDIVT